MKNCSEDPKPRIFFPDTIWSAEIFVFIKVKFPWFKLFKNLRFSNFLRIMDFSSKIGTKTEFKKLTPLLHDKTIGFCSLTNRRIISTFVLTSHDFSPLRDKIFFLLSKAVLIGASEISLTAKEVIKLILCLKWCLIAHW